MKITIGGTPGSGKNTVANELGKKLNFRVFVAGDFQRKMAEEKGMTILELAKAAETDPSIDKKTDEWVQAIGEADENFIMVGRTAFNFIQDSVKIFLDVSEDEGARRIFHEKRGKEKENISQAATFENIKKRKAFENERYKKYYGIDVTNPKNYDLVIDTTSLTVNKVVEKILKFMKEEHPEG